MQAIDKQERFRQSVARDVNNMLKSIPNIQSTFNGFHGYAWSAVKNPSVLLLPTFAEKHAKAYKQMVDTCAHYFGDSHFFNMCTRMAEISMLKQGAEHHQVTAKRQNMMSAFVRVQNSMLFTTDGAHGKWDQVVKAVAKKTRGFDAHLVEMSEMLEACRGLLMVIQEALTSVVQRQGVTELAADMAVYYEKINDEREEAIMA